MIFPTLTPKLCNNKLKGTSGGAAGYYRDFPIVIDYFQPNDEFTLQINISSKYDPDNSELERYWQAKKTYFKRYNFSNCNAIFNYIDTKCWIFSSRKRILYKFLLRQTHRLFN